MARRIEDANVSVGCPLSSSSFGYGEGEGWKHLQFHIHGFANLGSTKNHFIESPKFYCNGHQWQLLVFPGGFSDAAEGQVSVYLRHLSEETVKFSSRMMLIDKFGERKRAFLRKQDLFANKMSGWKDVISRSKILDESKNLLDDNGTLTFVVSIEEEPTTVFVPSNPCFKIIQEMFNDVNSADVCFVVSSTDEETLSLHAHRLILEQCAPMLAAICGSNDSGEAVTVTVNDIKPDVFHCLLEYVYGRTIPGLMLSAHAKDIIDAADKYSIVNLKLDAEAAYVESTDISLDNAMDNLLYADSMNLALLKEAVMNFLAENHREAAANISFSDFPGHVVKDLLIAFSSYVNKDEYEACVDEMSVDALRRKLNNMGLEVDGSREVMIESIKSASRSSPVFGAPAPAGGAGGLFGGPARAPAPVPAFGFGAAPAPAAGGLLGAPAPAGGAGGLFGGPAPFGFGAAPAPAAGGLLGAPAPAGGAGGLFGGPARAPAPASTNGSAPAPAAGGLFGAPASS